MKIIHFADLHLGVENYGRIDPATGLSSRLLDFLAVFDELVDYALAEKVDLVLFCGDAYKTREPTQTQQREFAKRIGRLAGNNIPVFILTGNHDLPNAIGRATATEIFDTLAVKNVYVANKPDNLTIPTKSGHIQITAIPWLRRSALLSREDSRNLTTEQVTQKMQEALSQIIAAKAQGLDRDLPAVLAAHVMVGDAKVGPGSESMMSIGNEPAVLLGNIALPVFDYVALGHVHKQQVLNEQPPVVYAGSLERIDFGEENDEKGFYAVNISLDSSGEKHTAYEFHPVNARKFLTVNITLQEQDMNPAETIKREVSNRSSGIKNAVVRVGVTYPPSLEPQIRNNDIQDYLKEAYYTTISRNVVRETKIRMGDYKPENLTRLEALKRYLEIQDTSEEQKSLLLEYGKKLISEQEEVE